MSSVTVSVPCVGGVGSDGFRGGGGGGARGPPPKETHRKFF